MNTENGNKMKQNFNKMLFFIVTKYTTTQIYYIY